ncbi:MAG: hypothetical protein E5Y87_07505, partial [Mesorhizobium sp.]
GQAVSLSSFPAVCSLKEDRSCQSVGQTGNGIPRLEERRGTAPPSGLPAISPTRGEIGCHRRFRQSPTLQERAERRRCQSPPSGHM